MMLSMFVDIRESRREVKKPPISTGGAEAWATSEMQAPAPHQPSLAKVLLTSTADDRRFVWYLSPLRQSHRKGLDPCVIVLCGQSKQVSPLARRNDVLAAPMPRPARDTTTYTGNRADGDSTNIYGNVYGDVHFPGRPREAGEPSPHQCLRDLRVTDPREDRARIEGDKDRLLRDCYTWILDEASFQRWKTQDESRLL
jgi:hypothetical protein